MLAHRPYAGDVRRAAGCRLPDRGLLRRPHDRVRRHIVAGGAEANRVTGRPRAGGRGAEGAAERDIADPYLDPAVAPHLALLMLRDAVPDPLTPEAAETEASPRRSSWRRARDRAGVRGHRGARPSPRAARRADRHDDFAATYLASGSAWTRPSRRTSPTSASARATTCDAARPPPAAGERDPDALFDAFVDWPPTRAWRSTRLRRRRSSR